MIDLQLIGIGTGNPDHLTRAGERAMRDADLILLPRKRADTADLLDLRLALCDAVLGDRSRVAIFDLPRRDAAAPYLPGVEQWHDSIADAWAGAVAAHLPDGGRLALLVWGDPSLYDSTLRITERLRARGMGVRVDVLPGITSLQALTAAHAIPLNTLGAPVAVTTGRRLAQDGWPTGFDSLAVMLDGQCAFDTIDPDGIHMWWGAYLGMPQQALAAGPLGEIAAPIRTRRAALRAEHGWIMDTYLLRRGVG
ncbi:precorrin-6A synthase (deacetylating) [Sphingomonas gellani]|uniref:Precorrin-6A synthase [deacetylating] n=1 Tax=Sphingomonas gellani TaxID=1166340 RepID=A0A1H8CS74_9SPHN|nr:precorrin-6A synthase (deacetylating) [Sphingomonas gellani]SEM97856.1 precorrin-6A synthase (deacetylating) [Sphingomonas gellani]